MTDKEFINALNDIKIYCRKSECSGCRFCIKSKDGSVRYNKCQIEELGWVLASMPRYWNTEEIKRIVYE